MALSTPATPPSPVSLNVPRPSFGTEMPCVFRLSMSLPQACQFFNMAKPSETTAPEVFDTVPACNDKLKSPGEFQHHGKGITRMARLPRPAGHHCGRARGHQPAGHDPGGGRLLAGTLKRHHLMMSLMGF